MKFGLIFLFGVILSMAQADEKTVKYLSPSDFSNIPKDLQVYLTKKGYKIPQASFFNKKPHNVIKGDFIGNGESFAILANNGKTHLLVLWRDQKTKEFKEQEVGVSDDSEFMQGWGEGKSAYSHMVGLAPKQSVAKANPKLKITHDGLHDSFADKSSILYYFQNGKWETVAGGAD